MEYKDYYKVLGVSRDTDEKGIKSAFRKLARECHPDVNPGDLDCEERFKEINEAYEALSDSEKRAKYDQLGAEWQRYQKAGGQPGGFNSTFGGMRGARRGGAREGYVYRPRPRRGRDYEQEVGITLREAYQGTTRILEKDVRHLEVVIPPGAKTGTRVRMSGEGGQGAASGESGDLYLRVRVQTDPEFEREGDDLRASVPVDLYTAVLGGEVRVPTLSRSVMLTIPEGTQNGRVFRLQSKGMPRLRDPKQHGDLYARVDVQLPTDLTPRQRELFEELRRT